MNLTVAMKIIGGFAIISIILIASSVSSLFNLNTIDDSTNHQNNLAIPTLKDSNRLSIEVSKMTNLALKGFYQTDLVVLSESLTAFKNTDNHFSSVFNKLKTLIKNEKALTSNLNEVTDVYKIFINNAHGVFDKRKSSLEQTNTLTDTITKLEDKFNSISSLLFDLSNHDLADTKLQRAITFSELLEEQLNSLVILSFDYRDALLDNKISLAEAQILDELEANQYTFDQVINELTLNSINSVAEKLSIDFSDIKKLFSDTSGLLYQKKLQLNTNQQAKVMLQAVEESTVEINAILDKQVDLANQVTSTTAELIKSSVSNGSTQTILIMVASIIIAIVITRITLISITRPLSRVNDMFNVVSSGDFSRKLDESGQDEFALLSKNCNLLIDSLRNLIEGIVNRSSQLAAAAEQTSAVTAESTTAIEEQRNQVEQAASATTEMSSTAQNVLISVQETLDGIQQADKEAERVKYISTNNRETIEQLAVEVESASQVINKLQQDTASIGSILDVIRSISDQTNLLALNAAIEAARAGEHGRGFAVVADEVRTLAARTQDSTAEIQTMIEVLQTGSSKAVSVMEAGKLKADDCVKQSENAEEALEVITKAVSQAFERSSQIATATQEQSVVAHEISENLESIVAIAEQTTAGSQQTAASSSEVAKLSEELQQSVQEFKL